MRTSLPLLVYGVTRCADVLGLSHYLLYLVTYDNAHLVDAKDAYDKVVRMSDIVLVYLVFDVMVFVGRWLVPVKENRHTSRSVN